MLTTYAFDDLRNFIKRDIYKAQYQRSGSWYDAPITEIVITNGIVRVKAQVSPGVACTIQAVRLINQEQQVFCQKAVNIVLETPSTNLMQWFDFSITESEVS